MMERRYLNMEERKRNNGGVAEERNLVVRFLRIIFSLNIYTHSQAHFVALMSAP